MHLPAQQQEAPEEKAKDEGAGQVRVVHDVLVYRLEGVEGGEALGGDVCKVDPQLCHGKPRTVGGWRRRRDRAG
jgi:hypothetical protein